MTVRRRYIIKVLHWLIANNPLSRAIEINDCLFSIWDDKFISFDITNNLVNCNPKHYERLGYAANLCEDHFENDFHAAIVDTGSERDYIYSGYIYSDIDDGR